ncbi:HesA/MoeB/ThiF family protein [Paracoccus tegillarcae]|uniref:Molybdopterin-synthase adenylyltransferase n=1 Tax=Paracoccus tegillarcae TaxID=1529068 RepID=A0A2K9ENN4_9RHOB|nr:HesA/MoeB/ThiF family protein [Paracoccus tegillarcae]AUH32316.1 molybdopterin biosynthesis protein [Paracoccus tegillarcae]
MLIWWLMIGFAFAAFVVKVPARPLFLAALAIWLGFLAIHLVAPDSPAARIVGGSFAGWLVAGALLALSWGYRIWVRRLRTRATGDRAATADQPAPVRAMVQPEPDPVTPDPADAPMSGDELDRYARHIVLREIGGAGQMRLRRANVLLIGAGGLGAPAALYLAAAGVGRITIADDDRVSLSNLQRQVIFRTNQTGRQKAEAAAVAMRDLNHYVTVTPLNRWITQADADLIASHDLVLDGTDSFKARAAINAACVEAKVPLIAGSIAQWEGQVTLYDPAYSGPCMACVFPQAPADGLAPACAEAGVVGALPGVIGSLMALEAIKHLTGAGQGLRGRMLIFDGLYGETRTITTSVQRDCPVCGGRGY